MTNECDNSPPVTNPFGSLVKSSRGTKGSPPFGEKAEAGRLTHTHACVHTIAEARAGALWGVGKRSSSSPTQPNTMGDATNGVPEANDEVSVQTEERRRQQQLQEAEMHLQIQRDAFDKYMDMLLEKANEILAKQGDHITEQGGTYPNKNNGL
uniref:Myb family transcription factor APL n=1 Tax=Anthurium amnicola TaxID=1678845 RepID=A0A1D1ZCM5_9ARAE